MVENRANRNQLRGLLFLLIFVGLLPYLAHAEIDVRVDRNPVQEDESFAIQFSSPDVDGDPDFAPLQTDFKILQTSQNRNLQLINGVMKQSVSWTLMLAPLHSGRIIIPSIAFGSEKSPKLVLEVKPTANASNGVGREMFFVEVDADTKSAYVQSQILVTVKLYLGNPNIMEPHLDELSVSDKDASIEKLSQDADYTKRLGGKSYRVIEKRYVVFPQTPGTLTINAIQFETRYIDDRRALRYKQAKSNPLDIEVKPIPSKFASNYWLPASDLQLLESWTPELDKLKQGEPATRTLTIIATGATSNLLPPIGQENLSFAKQYPDQPSLSDDSSGKGVIGKRVEKIAIIPSQAGRFTLPSIEIPWWNTKKHRMEIARIKSRSVNVAAATNLANKQAASSPPVTTQKNTNSNSLIEKTVSAQNTSPLLVHASNRWFYISVTLGILWIATLAAWLKSSRHRRESTDLSKEFSHLSRRKVEKAIESAVGEGDLQKIKRLLVEWSVVVWGPRAPRSIGGMRHRSNKALADELEYLNNLLYSGDTPRHWDGQGLCAALKSYKDNDENHNREGLHPLYQGMQ